MNTLPSVDELKELGNQAIKDQRYEESVLHYTQAIKLAPKNYAIYSNRSLAFLKLQQYYYAMEDANETIRLNPKWAKGYFRKAEVEYATSHYTDAYKSYERALELQPDDNVILQAMAKANREQFKDMRADDQIPWLGAGIGIVFGVALVIANFLYAAKPTHPLLMVITTVLIAIFGYAIARMYRYFVRCQRDGLLAAPIREGAEEVKEGRHEESEGVKEAANGAPPSARFTKSQARQRYKRGKMQ